MCRSFCSVQGAVYWRECNRNISPLRYNNINNDHTCSSIYRKIQENKLQFLLLAFKNVTFFLVFNVQLSPGSLYNCVRPGHFPYQLDCIRFYRCFEVVPGVLKGLLYRCPTGYGYSITTERCEKEATLPPCDRSFVKIGDYPSNYF